MQAGGDVCALSGIGAQKLDRVDVEREGEFLQHIDGGGIFFAFQHADVIAVDLGKMGKLLLRDRFLLSQPTQVPCDSSRKFMREESPAT